MYDAQVEVTFHRPLLGGSQRRLLPIPKEADADELRDAIVKAVRAIHPKPAVPGVSIELTPGEVAAVADAMKLGKGNGFLRGDLEAMRTLDGNVVVTRIADEPEEESEPDPKQTEAIAGVGSSIAAGLLKDGWTFAQLLGDGLALFQAPSKS